MVPAVGAVGVGDGDPASGLGGATGIGGGGGGAGAGLNPFGGGALRKATFSEVMDLESCSAEFQVPVGSAGAKRGRVLIVPSSGCTGVLKVQVRSAGSGARDFPTAKTLDLTAASDQEVLSEDDLIGVDTLAIIGPDAAQAGKTVRISVVLDLDV